MDRSDFHRQVVDGALVMLNGWSAGSNHWTFDVMYSVVQDAPEIAWPLLIELADRADDQQLASLGAGFLEDFIATHGRQFIDRIEDRAASDPRFRRSLQNVWRQGGPKDLWDRIVPLLDGRPERTEGIEIDTNSVDVSVAGLPPGSPGSPEDERARRRRLLEAVRDHDDRAERGPFVGPVAINLRFEPGPSTTAIVDPSLVLGSVLATISQDGTRDAELADVADVALLTSSGFAWELEYSRIRRRVEGYRLEVRPMHEDQVSVYDGGDSDGWTGLDVG